MTVHRPPPPARPSTRRPWAPSPRSSSAPACQPWSSRLVYLGRRLGLYEALRGTPAHRRRSWPRPRGSTSATRASGSSSRRWPARSPSTTPPPRPTSGASPSPRSTPSCCSTRSTPPTPAPWPTSSIRSCAPSTSWSSAFRTGEGVAFSAYGLHDMQAGFTRPMFANEPGGRVDPAPPRHPGPPRGRRAPAHRRHRLRRGLGRHLPRRGLPARHRRRLRPRRRLHRPGPQARLRARRGRPGALRGAGRHRHQLRPTATTSCSPSRWCTTWPTRSTRSPPWSASPGPTAPCSSIDENAAETFDAPTATRSSGSSTASACCTACPPAAPTSTPPPPAP